MLLVVGVEPVPNIRNGIFVERFVKALRYVTYMGRCQYVVQRPERVRRRQGLIVEYVDRRAGDLLILQHADQRALTNCKQRNLPGSGRSACTVRAF